MLSIGHDGVVPDEPAIRQTGPGTREGSSVASGLSGDADRKAMRTRYTRLVREYHPDHNGGDRSYETRLQCVVEAYQLLRKAVAFA